MTAHPRATQIAHNWVVYNRLGVFKGSFPTFAEARDRAVKLDLCPFRDVFFADGSEPVGKRLDLHLIDRYLEAMVAENGGSYPEWLKKHDRDAFLLHDMAEAYFRGRDYERDKREFLDDYATGGRVVDVGEV